MELLGSRMRKGRWNKIMKKRLRRSDRALEKEIPQLPRSLYDDYFRTRRRHLFEEPYSLRRRTAEDLALAYILTGRTEYLDRCRDYIWAIMEEFTWVIPAHAGFVPAYVNRGAKNAGFSPSPNAVTRVDLSSSGTSLLLADLWDLLHNDLDSETLKWMRHNILRRVLIPLRDYYDKQWWARAYESNWCGFCCGNSGCALILTALSQPWAADLLYRFIQTIEKFLASADPEGAWVEGVGYWFYGFSRVVYLSDLLAKVTDGRLDLLANPMIKATSTFPIWTYLPPRFQVNFGDTPNVATVYPEIMRRFMDHYQDSAIAWYLRRLEEENLLDGGSLRDLLWVSESSWKPLPPREKSRWYHRIGVIITRSSWIDLDASVLAVKAGHNNEPHNHLDIGHFIYHCLGNTFICDIGVGRYDREYFGPTRYENPVCGAEGHNLIFVDGRSEVPGREYEGRIVEYRREREVQKIRIDLSKAYPSEVLSEAFRTLFFMKNEGIVLIDDIKCQEGAVVESRLHFKGKARVTPIGVELSIGKRMVLVAPKEPDSLNIEIGTHKGLKLRDPEISEVKYIRLLKKAQEGCVRIQADIVPHQTKKELETRLEKLRTVLAQATL